MKHIKSIRVFESTEPYLPTHEELENLPVFKEMLRLVLETGILARLKFNTGPVAYRNGTRKLSVNPYTTYSMYPYKGIVQRHERGGSKFKNDFSSIEGWEQAIAEIFIRFATGHHVFMNAVNTTGLDPKVLEKLKNVRKGFDYYSFFARYNATPASIMKQIIKHSDERCIVDLLKNPATPLEIVVKILSKPLSAYTWRTSLLLDARKEAISTLDIPAEHLISIITVCPELEKAAEKNPNYPDDRTEWALSGW